MTIELWKPIYLLEGMSEVNPCYLISNYGRVKGVSGITIKPVLSVGYLRTNLTRKDRSGYANRTKTVLIHRLVALAFVEGYEPNLVVNHIDENKLNNMYSNLEWITVKQNNIHGTVRERIRESSTGGKKPVRTIDVKTGKVLEFESMTKAEKEGFLHKSVWRACHGITNGYKWEYI